jgi:hypothetical protein
MARVDDEITLTRYHLGIEAVAIGQAMLDSDYEEARFRAHLLHSQACDLAIDEVADAARDVLHHLPMGGPPKTGIGRAMLRLSSAVDAVR